MAKISENKLLDGYRGVCNGGDLISRIGNEDIWWVYRNEGGCSTDGRRAYGSITLENSRHGQIDLARRLTASQSATLARIDLDYQRLWGTEVE